ncbi:hypothetical protein RhiJN_22541 [Ceratobasidium sp. AG-Ba]|nr:hypothetical protein RhiJN_22541 [Ceratobasidium sp. AG-Ba]
MCPTCTEEITKLPVVCARCHKEYEVVDSDWEHSSSSKFNSEAGLEGSLNHAFTESDIRQVINVQLVNLSKNGEVVKRLASCVIDALNAMGSKQCGATVNSEAGHHHDPNQRSSLAMESKHMSITHLGYQSNVEGNINTTRFTSETRAGAPTSSAEPAASNTDGPCADPQKQLAPTTLEDNLPMSTHCAGTRSGTALGLVIDPVLALRLGSSPLTSTSNSTGNTTFANEPTLTRQPEASTVVEHVPKSDSYTGCSREASLPTWKPDICVDYPQSISEPEPPLTCAGSTPNTYSSEEKHGNLGNTSKQETHPGIIAGTTLAAGSLAGDNINKISDVDKPASGASGLNTVGRDNDVFPPIQRPSDATDMNPIQLPASLPPAKPCVVAGGKENVFPPDTHSPSGRVPACPSSHLESVGKQTHALPCPPDSAQSPKTCLKDTVCSPKPSRLSLKPEGPECSNTSTGRKDSSTVASGPCHSNSATLHFDPPHQTPTNQSNSSCPAKDSACPKPTAPISETATLTLDDGKQVLVNKPGPACRSDQPVPPIFDRTGYPSYRVCPSVPTSKPKTRSPTCSDETSLDQPCIFANPRNIQPPICDPCPSLNEKRSDQLNGSTPKADEQTDTSAYRPCGGYQKSAGSNGVEPAVSKNQYFIRVEKIEPCGNAEGPVKGSMSGKNCMKPIGSQSELHYKFNELVAGTDEQVGSASEDNLVPLLSSIPATKGPEDACLESSCSPRSEPFPDKNNLSTASETPAPPHLEPEMEISECLKVDTIGARSSTTIEIEDRVSEPQVTTEPGAEKESRISGTTGKKSENEGITYPPDNTSDESYTSHMGAIPGQFPTEFEFCEPPSGHATTPTFPTPSMEENSDAGSMEEFTPAIVPKYPIPLLNDPFRDSVPASDHILPTFPVTNCPGPARNLALTEDSEPIPATTISDLAMEINKPVVPSSPFIYAPLGKLTHRPFGPLHRHEPTHTSFVGGHLRNSSTRLIYGLSRTFNLRSPEYPTPNAEAQSPPTAYNKSKIVKDEATTSDRESQEGVEDENKLALGCDELNKKNGVDVRSGMILSTTDPCPRPDDTQSSTSGSKAGCNLGTVIDYCPDTGILSGSSNSIESPNYSSPSGEADHKVLEEYVKLHSKGGNLSMRVSAPDAHLKNIALLAEDPKPVDRVPDGHAYGQQEYSIAMVRCLVGDAKERPPLDLVEDGPFVPCEVSERDHEVTPETRLGVSWPGKCPVASLSPSTGAETKNLSKTQHSNPGKFGLNKHTTCDDVTEAQKNLEQAKGLDSGVAGGQQSRGALLRDPKECDDTQGDMGSNSVQNFGNTHPAVTPTPVSSPTHPIHPTLGHTTTHANAHCHSVPSDSDQAMGNLNNNTAHEKTMVPTATSKTARLGDTQYTSTLRCSSHNRRSKEFVTTIEQAGVAKKFKPSFKIAMEDPQVAQMSNQEEVVRTGIPLNRISTQPSSKTTTAITHLVVFSPFLVLLLQTVVAFCLTLTELGTPQPPPIPGK